MDSRRAFSGLIGWIAAPKGYGCQLHPYFTPVSRGHRSKIISPLLLTSMQVIVFSRIL